MNRPSINVSAMIAASVFTVSACTTPCSAELPYDNTHLLLGDGERLVHPHEAVTLAQPFRTDGRNTTITSVTLPIGRVGVPEGEVRISIWDEENGVPGQPVSQLGTITDLASLSVITRDQAVLDSITFTKTIAGLEPNATYYVHLDLTNVISTPGGIANNVGNGALGSPEGTNGAGSLLGVFRGTTEWFDVSQVTGNRGYLQMSVNAVPEPGGGVLAVMGLSAVVFCRRRRIMSRALRNRPAWRRGGRR